MCYNLVSILNCSYTALKKIVDQKPTLYRSQSASWHPWIANISLFRIAFDFGHAGVGVSKEHQHRRRIARSALTDEQRQFLTKLVEQAPFDKHAQEFVLQKVREGKFLPPIQKMAAFPRPSTPFV